MSDASFQCLNHSPIDRQERSLHQSYSELDVYSREKLQEWLDCRLAGKEPKNQTSWTALLPKYGLYIDANAAFFKSALCESDQLAMLCLVHPRTHLALQAVQGKIFDKIRQKKPNLPVRGRCRRAELRRYRPQNKVHPQVCT